MCLEGQKTRWLSLSEGEVRVHPNAAANCSSQPRLSPACWRSDVVRPFRPLVKCGGKTVAGELRQAASLSPNPRCVARHRHKVCPNA